ncbi:MAG: acid phosphatase, partial [Gammaproteobacteria bacterium]
MNRDSFALRGTPRWKLAANDAHLDFPHAAEAFSCALNAAISAQHTPHLYRLISRTESDAILSTHAAKNNYHRPRPFVLNNQPLCTPHKAEHLRQEGSYPSGHAAVGWAWALILSEVVPERTDALLA